MGASSSSSSAFCGCSDALTLPYARSTRPSAPIRYETRAGALALASSAAPYARPIFLSVSLRSGKLNWYFSANFRFASIGSKLMP
jgi:hypothetical protein